MAVSVYPWEIAVEPAAAAPSPGSTQNHLNAEVLSVTRVGNRVRLGLAGPQPLAAEITGRGGRRARTARRHKGYGQLEGVGHAPRGDLSGWVRLRSN